MYAPSPQTTKPFVLPAPIGGINALTNLMGMSPEDCVAAINYIPQTNGMKIRRGYKNVGYGFSGVSAGVRTLIPYEGTTSVDDRLFACTLEGIYNVTAEATSYTTASEGIAWAAKTGNAGYCSYVTYTTIADKFLLVADEVNGLYKYQESTATWSAVTGLTGDIATDGYDGDDVVFVTVWKQRVWLVLRDSGTAYYLDVGVIGGDCTRINFGNKFPTGGFLHSIHNFTMDGGNGPDDYLVALSSAGDVVAYQGINPDTVDTFSAVGIWNIGRLPVGRNITTSAGGDLYVLCSYGLVSLAQMFKGTEPGTIPAYITGKITPLVRVDVAAALDTRGWNVVDFTTDGLLLITVPYNGTSYTIYRQYVMNTTTRAWCLFLGLPAHCAVEWKGALYTGAVSAATGALFKYTGTQDNVTYGGTAGVPINSFLLTAFAGSGANTRLQFIKPQFIGRGIPLYELEARYDFDVNSTVETIAGALPAAGGSDWGDTWGAAYWGESSLLPFSELKGAFGIGKFTAIALTTRSIYEATLAGFTAMADQGGLL